VIVTQTLAVTHLYRTDSAAAYVARPVKWNTKNVEAYVGA